MSKLVVDGKACAAFHDEKARDAWTAFAEKVEDLDALGEGRFVHAPNT